MAARGKRDSDPPGAQEDDPQVLTKHDCARMGRSLSAWYFGEGGLLMSEDARNAYFNLMTSLGRAIDAKGELASPTVEMAGSVISLSDIKSYGDELKFSETTVPDRWEFGIVPGEDSLAWRFKDFLLIQRLASRFRTALTSDLESRKPPKGVDV